MNALNTNTRSLDNNAARHFFVSTHAPSRPQRRERDFGIGYGTSSGYASPRRYIGDNGPRMFRFA